MNTTHIDSFTRAAASPVSAPRKRSLRSSIALVLASVASIAAMSLVSPDVQAGECYKDTIGRIVSRRRVGFVEVPCPDRNTPAHMAGNDIVEVRGAEGSPVPRQQVRHREAPTSVSALPLPNLMALAEDETPIDRWDVVEHLGQKTRWWDSYNRNPLKGDKPVKDDWFFSMSIASDTAVELRSVPGFANGVAGTHGSHQSRLSQNVVSEFTVYQGDTVFMPPKWLFRFAPSFSYNQIDLDQPEPLDAGLSGSHSFVGVQTAYAEKLLRVASERYDFDSLRVGIQPFSTDFRGFLYQGSQAGVRFYGTRGGNQWQYNVAWLRRLADDEVSGLANPAAGLRHDEMLVANLYRQDFPVAGFTSQLSLLHNRNREGSEAGSAQTRSTDLNTPFSHGLRDYDVTYVGYNGDGHVGRLNLTTSAYYAFGKQTSRTIEGASADISAYFVAAELSADFSWIRPRISMLYASGDKNPTDGKLNGFDSVGENPQFAGSDASYALRQSIPVLGFGTAAPSSRNGVLNSLRSSSNDRQSNFNNPGTMLFGVGVDMDLTPKLRTSVNLNSVHFADTRILEVTRKQSGLDSHIGYDASVSMIWRPLATQNVIIRAAYGALLPGGSYKSLFPGVKLDHMLVQATLNY